MLASQISKKPTLFCRHGFNVVRITHPNAVLDRGKSRRFARKASAPAGSSASMAATRPDTSPRLVHDLDGNLGPHGRVDIDCLSGHCLVFPTW